MLSNFTRGKTCFGALALLVVINSSVLADENRFPSVLLTWRSDGEEVQAARSVWPSERLSAVRTDLDGDGTAEILVRFDGRCVTPVDPEDDPGCPYSLLKWTGDTWKILFERSAWSVSAYARPRSASGSGASVTALEIDGDLFTLDGGVVQSYDAGVSHLRDATADEANRAAKAHGRRLSAGIEAITGLIDIDADGVAEHIVHLRLPQADENAEDEMPSPWVILDASGKVMAKGESFAMPVIQITPNGDSIAVSATPAGLFIAKLN